MTRPTRVLSKPLVYQKRLQESCSHFRCYDGRKSEPFRTHLCPSLVIVTHYYLLLSGCAYASKQESEAQVL